MKPYFDNGPVQLYQADARDLPLAYQSVHCVVTSPPYYGLRVYQGLGDQGIGLEASVEAYVANLVGVFAEVRRVLRDDGVLWLNLGDSYASPPGQRGSRGTREDDPKYGGADGRIESPARQAGFLLSDGNRLGIPERVVLALQADGWCWRDTVIWAKKSAMPESVNGWRWERCRVKTGREATDWSKTPKGWDTGEGSHDEIGGGNYRQNGDREATTATFEDCPGCPKCADNDGLVLRKGSWRCTSGHEYIFMLTKGMGYYADAEAVKTVALQTGHVENTWPDRGPDNGRTGFNLSQYVPTTANRRSVWNDISPEPYGGAHFATFPSDLPRICIQASTSERGCCPDCGSQWARIVETSQIHKANNVGPAKYAGGADGEHAGTWTAGMAEQTWKQSTTLGWRATCDHGGNPVPALVLDPFAGTATTCLAAQKLGRRAVGVDLSEAYLKQAVKRLQGVPLPMAL